MGLACLSLVGIAVSLVGAAFFLEKRAQVDIPLWTEGEKGVIVEVSGFQDRDGLYRLPEGTTVSSFIAALKPNAAGEVIVPPYLGVLPLRPGWSLRRGEDGMIGLGEMGAAKKIALGLPLDVNNATKEELMLIPGVKEATAEAIVRFRRDAGGRVRDLEELLGVKGIKEKRIAHLRKYLYAGPGVPTRRAVLGDDRSYRR